MPAWGGLERRRHRARRPVRRRCQPRVGRGPRGGARRTGNVRPRGGGRRSTWGGGVEHSILKTGSRQRARDAIPPPTRVGVAVDRGAGDRWPSRARRALALVVVTWPPVLLAVAGARRARRRRRGRRRRAPAAQRAGRPGRVPVVLAARRRRLLRPAASCVARRRRCSAGRCWLTHLVSPAGMGFGDVKAGAVAGAALGLIDPQLAVLALVARPGRRRRVGPRPPVPHRAVRPGLVAGALRRARRRPPGRRRKALTERPRPSLPSPRSRRW